MSTLPQNATDQLFRFSVEKFNELAVSGVIPMDTSVELIDGFIYEMQPLGPFHCSVSERIDRLLTKSASEDVLVREEKPVVLDDFTEPIPDIAVVRVGKEDPFFQQSHPTPPDVILLIEVSDSSYLHDRNVKLVSYAKSNVPEVWIVNVQQKRVEWFRKPNSSEAVYLEEGVFENDEVIDRGDFSLDLSKIEL